MIRSLYLPLYPTNFEEVVINRNIHNGQSNDNMVKKSRVDICSKTINGEKRKCISARPKRRLRAYIVANKRLKDKRTKVNGSSNKKRSVKEKSAKRKARRVFTREKKEVSLVRDLNSEDEEVEMKLSKLRERELN
ncbi:hypothetical protein AAHE18_20G099800 [Arachis hypogaea]